MALASRLDRSRWTPSVVCLGPEGALAGVLRDRGIAVTCLNVSKRRPIRAVRDLASALRAIRPAIVQSFLFHANLAARLAAFQAGRPPVVGGIRVAERRGRSHLVLERLTQRLSAASVCVSEGVRRHAIESGGLDPRRLLVIPNGIDPEAIDRAGSVDLGLGPAKILMFVGRIEPQKGVGVLLEAFSAVAPDHPGWRLVMVGDGPDVSEHRRRVEGSGVLKDRVEWLGRREDVPGLLKTADLVVLPSLWEGMPNVVIEAMAARKPVIATRVEGSEDLVLADGPERTGWLAEPGDPKSLAASLREAMAGETQWGAMGQKGRSRVEAEYSMGRVVEAYEAVWAGVLGFKIEASGGR